MVVPFGTAFPPTWQPRFGGAFQTSAPSEINPLTEQAETINALAETPTASTANTLSIIREVQANGATRLNLSE